MAFTLETIHQCCIKPNTQLLYDPATALKGIYSTEMRTYAYPKIFTPTLTVDLFIIAKNLKQPDVPHR